jgi:dethiobiotin synthetase
VPGRLIVVTGTGTGIGKTHFAEALLLAWGRAESRVTGLKPVESGVADGGDTASDSARLARASSFHVKHGRTTLAEPVSPHLAARRQGLTLEAGIFTAAAATARAEADGVVLELPGGLFTPLAPGLLNAHIALELRPDALLLVAPDRLGVLHDIGAAVRAAQGLPLRLDGIVLVTPPCPDASTGRNGPELPALVPVPLLATLPRGTPDQLSLSPELGAILTTLAAGRR